MRDLMSQPEEVINAPHGVEARIDRRQPEIYDA
jgi:hypothetical protein